MICECDKHESRRGVDQPPLASLPRLNAECVNPLRHIDRLLFADQVIPSIMPRRRVIQTIEGWLRGCGRALTRRSGTDRKGAA